MTGHHCHARGCSTPCAPEMLMCRAHWAKVPHSMKKAIYATYRPGQCDDKHPSLAWHRAADAAIAFVAELERVERSPERVRAELKALRGASR